MSFVPLGELVRLRATKSASAGGQLEHPSEVNSSTITGVSAQAPQTRPTTNATIARNRNRNVFILPDRTRELGGKFQTTIGILAPNHVNIQNLMEFTGAIESYEQSGRMARAEGSLAATSLDQPRQ